MMPIQLSGGFVPSMGSISLYFHMLEVAFDWRYLFILISKSLNLLP